MMELMETLGTFLLVAVIVFLVLTLLSEVHAYHKRKKREAEQDGFSRLMREMLELDADRLKVQEDLLREACRSWAETDEEEDE